MDGNLSSRILKTSAPVHYPQEEDMLFSLAYSGLKMPFSSASLCSHPLIPCDASCIVWVFHTPEVSTLTFSLSVLTTQRPSVIMNGSDILAFATVCVNERMAPIMADKRDFRCFCSSIDNTKLITLAYCSRMDSDLTEGGGACGLDHS